MEIERQNPQWEDGFYYPYEKKRFIFDRLDSSLQSGMITGVYGLRRVGKSVLLRQLVNAMVERGAKRAKILCFSFDEENLDFWGVVREYERRQGAKVGRENCLFFDEIQKVPDWKAKVKLLYDTSAAKVVVSGSNSASLRKGGESLAGRINEFYLPELSFREFLYFKGREGLAGSGLGASLEAEFHDFLKRPFPELVLNERIAPSEYSKTIAKKIVFEDLPSAFPIDEPELLNSLFLLICRQPGSQLEYSRLASDLGRDRKTISRYLDFLAYGFLVRKLFNFSGNPFSSERKLKKFYPFLAAFCDCAEPAFIETAVAQILRAKFFWRLKDRYEVDFVLPGPLFALEVKFTERLSQSDWSGLRAFREAHPRATSAIVSRKAGKNVVPYWQLEGFLEEKGIKPE